MTDNEIIKAYGCCNLSIDECGWCDNCPCKIEGDCIVSSGFELEREVFNLLNRQKAEIERLEQNLEEAHIDIKEHQAHIRNLKMVIDKIEDHINPLPFETDYDKAIRQAKAEAIKEFAERLKEIITMSPKNSILIDKWYIDNLVKEMVGES